LCDGGLWANNPSLVAYTDAITSFNSKKEDIRILSLGCGKNLGSYSSNSKFWGLITGYGGTEIVNFVMNIQSNFVDTTVKLHLKDNYLRINFDGSDLELDNYSAIDDFISEADGLYSKTQNDILKFIS